LHQLRALLFHFEFFYSLNAKEGLRLIIKRAALRATDDMFNRGRDQYGRMLQISTIDA
jgi:hypothetical protein